MDSSPRPTHLADLVRTAAARQADHPALVDTATGATLTWAELDATVSAESRRLTDAGLSPGAGQMLRREGLFQEIVGTFAHCLDGKLHIAVTSHEDDRNFRIEFPNTMQQSHAVYARHADICHDDPIETVADEFKNLVRTGKGLHAQAK